MDIVLLIVSFVSGILTVLAPCVLPLLPVIIGSSATSQNKYQPYIITASLAIFVTIFTILLKASTLLIDIDPQVWKSISGILVILFGLSYVFPILWAKLLYRLRLSNTSDQLLEKASEQNGVLKPILIGASLSPVFASCSPTYTLILATILPQSFASGLVYILVYSLGLALVMLLVALLGRKFIQKVKFFTNPDGIFRKSLGILFILIGVAVIVGWDKQFETWILETQLFDVTKIEESILKGSGLK